MNSEINETSRHYPPAFGDFLAQVAMERRDVSWLESCPIRYQKRESQIQLYTMKFIDSWILMETLTDLPLI